MKNQTPCRETRKIDTTPPCEPPGEEKYKQNESLHDESMSFAS